MLLSLTFSSSSFGVESESLHTTIKQHHVAAVFVAPFVE